MISHIVKRSLIEPSSGRREAPRQVAEQGGARVHEKDYTRGGTKSKR